MVKKIAMLLLLPTTMVASAFASPAADSLQATVYYRPGYSILDLSYMNNAESMDKLMEGIKMVSGNPNLELENILILSSSSPEGISSYNKRLAQRRGERLRDYLKKTLILPDSIFTLTSKGEDWVGLAESIAQTNVSWKNKALQIIRNTPEWVVKNGKIVDGRKRQLQNLNGGRAWNYMVENHFETLRSSALIVFEYKNVVPQPEVTPSDTLSSLNQQQGCNSDSLCNSNLGSTGAGQDSFLDEETVEVVKRNRYWALKTNLLYDAVLVPNIGVEASLGKGWSIGGNWMYAWWSKNSSHRYWRIYGGELDVRKYFGAKASEKPLQGHHIGVYGQWLTYDLENGGTGYQSKRTCGGGFEYGYSFPIGRRLNLDLGLGIGYLNSEYKTYVPEDGCYVYQTTKQREWFGPTKAEVSLVWLLGNGNVNSKKGGKK